MIYLEWYFLQLLGVRQIRIGSTCQQRLWVSKLSICQTCCTLLTGASLQLGLSRKGTFTLFLNHSKLVPFYQIWYICFYHHLKVAPEEVQFVSLHVPGDPGANREKATQIAFEIFNVPEFMYDATAHCAMYNAVTNLDVTYIASPPPHVLKFPFFISMCRGMVLQSGYEISHAYPLYEGNCLSHAIEGTAYGGADVTEALRKGIPQLRHERALPALMRQISSWKDQYAFCVSDGVLPPPFCDSVPPIESYSGMIKPIKGISQI